MLEDEDEDEESSYIVLCLRQTWMVIRPNMVNSIKEMDVTYKVYIL